MTNVSNRISKSAMMFMAVVAMLLNGCSGHKPMNPLDIVPENSTAGAVVDMTKLAEAAGLSSPAQDSRALNIFIPTPLRITLQNVAEAAPEALDLTKVIWFRMSNGYDVAAAEVKNPAKLAEAIEEQRDAASDFDDYTLYNINGRALAVSENLAVFAPDAATVRECGASGSKTLISQNIGLEQFLETDGNAVNVVSEAKSLGIKELNEQWICTSIRFTDDSATADISVMLPDGKVDEIGKRIAGEIDPAALQFVPQGATAVIATGLQPDDALFSAEDLTAMLFPHKIGQSETGTTLWYARPAGSLDPEDLFSPLRWNLATISQMPDTELSEAMDEMAEATGNRARKSINSDLMTYNIMGLPGSYGYINGYFTESFNGEASFGNSNSLAPLFEAARVVALLDIPLDSDLRRALNLPCGATVSLKIQTSDIRLKLQVFGTDKPVLALLTELPGAGGFMGQITGALN